MRTMKPINNLSANMTRTLLLILGIVVAALLTLNSGLIGDASSFLSTFRPNTALIEDNQQPDRIEQLKVIISAGKTFFSEINQLLKTI
jgi:hypothetical protein